MCVFIFLPYISIGLHIHGCILFNKKTCSLSFLSSLIVDIYIYEQNTYTDICETLPLPIGRSTSFLLIVAEYLVI